MKDYTSDIKRQMNRARDNVIKKSMKAVRIAIIETGSQIIINAPVITGRLRGNWQTGINSAPSGVKDVTGVGAYTGAMTELANQIASFNFNDVAYLVNNLPYAQFIEYGDYEGQHSQGQIRQATAEFPQKLKKARLQQGLN